MSLYYKFHDRQSNMEYLRILAMFLIVLSHIPLYINYPVNGSLLFTYQDYIIRIFRNLGRVGTNVFVLLAGYFSIKSHFKLSSLLKLWFLTFFYSFFIFIIIPPFSDLAYNFRYYLIYMFPIVFGKYWFVSCYFCLYLFSPFLIKGIKALTQKQHLYLIYILIIWWCILPTFVIYPAYPNGVNYNILIWFFILYIVGSYFRLYVCPEQINIHKHIMYIYFSVFLFVFYLITIDGYTGEIYKYLERNNLFIFIISISIFLLFLKIKSKPKKKVNNISVCMIGVYLIHYHPSIESFILKHQIIETNNENILLKIIVWAIVVFIMSTCIEYIRRTLCRPLSVKMLKFIEPLDEKIRDTLLETPNETYKNKSNY